MMSLSQAQYIKISNRCDYCHNKFTDGDEVRVIVSHGEVVTSDDKPMNIMRVALTTTCLKCSNILNKYARKVKQPHDITVMFYRDFKVEAKQKKKGRVNKR